MTLEKAKKLLGKSGEKYSDDELEQIIKMVKSFADVCCDHIIKRYGSAVNTENANM